MAAKSDAPAPAPASAAPAPEAAAPAEPATKKPSGLLVTLLPAGVALLAAPVLTWFVAAFVLMPHLEKRLLAAVNGVDGAARGAAPAEGPAAPKNGEPGAAANTYEFNNIVVNLAGTMGTRYLKTSFLVSGAKDSDIKGAFEAKKPQLTDVTLNVLSSLTLADLEEPGAKNVIREKLVAAYNQALGKKVAEQVYFSDFVIQ